MTTSNQNETSNSKGGGGGISIANIKTSAAAAAAASSSTVATTPTTSNSTTKTTKTAAPVAAVTTQLDQPDAVLGTVASIPDEVLPKKNDGGDAPVVGTAAARSDYLGGAAPAASFDSTRSDDHLHLDLVLAPSTTSVLENDRPDVAAAAATTTAAAATSGTTAAASTNAKSAAVTPFRKEELLLQARSDRLRWIQQVPLPYQKQVTQESSNCSNTTDTLSKFLTTSHAAQHLPAAAPVLRHLWHSSKTTTTTTPPRPSGGIGQTSIPDSVLRLDQELEPHDVAFLTGNQILAAELELVTDAETKALLVSYQSFLHLLQDPACGVLVQGMRTFCRNLNDDEPDADANPTEDSKGAAAAAKLQAYCAATVQNVRQHAAFAEWLKHNDNELLRRSVESFIFGQCRSRLESLFQTQATSEQDQGLQKKLQSLDFVTPAHLEIACFANTEETSSRSAALKELLSEPCKALESVDSYHSVYEKLQRVLAIYRGVNAALTTALKGEKSPSADDVLPTIILTVLQTAPPRLFLNLRLMEDLSPPEYLRGEAGYAYTNLYGAAQFLQDLDLEKEPALLHISETAFRSGVAAHRAKVEERLKALRHNEESPDDVGEKASLLSTDVDTTCVNVPSPLEIRQARLRGETVDLAWALEWQEKNGGQVDPSLLASCSSRRRDADTEDAAASLPTGFRRNYSYLMTRPEDIRVSDLSLLLEEYRMLVRATEHLLGERTAKAVTERKLKSRAVENNLLATARSLDPTLLVPVTGKSKNTH